MGAGWVIDRLVAVACILAASSTSQPNLYHASQHELREQRRQQCKEPEVNDNELEQWVRATSSVFCHRITQSRVRTCQQVVPLWLLGLPMLAGFELSPYVHMALSCLRLLHPVQCNTVFSHAACGSAGAAPSPSAGALRGGLARRRSSDHDQRDEPGQPAGASLAASRKLDSCG